MRHIILHLGILDVLHASTSIGAAHTYMGGIGLLEVEFINMFFSENLESFTKCYSETGLPSPAIDC
jgi:hypothetical protein